MPSEHRRECALTGVATVECDIDDPFAALYLAGSFGMQVRGWGSIVGSCRALANWLNLDLKLLCDEFGDPSCHRRHRADSVSPPQS
jgi:hypothetical protein